MDLTEASAALQSPLTGPQASWSSKRSAESFILGRNNSMLLATKLENSMSKTGLGVLVDI